VRAEETAYGCRGAGVHAGQRSVERGRGAEGLAGRDACPEIDAAREPVSGRQQTSQLVLAWNSTARVEDRRLELEAIAERHLHRGMAAGLEEPVAAGTDPSADLEADALADGHRLLGAQQPLRHAVGQRPPAAFQAGGEAAAPGRLPTREVGRHVKAAAGETRGIEAEAVVDLEPDPDVFCGSDADLGEAQAHLARSLELGEAAEGDGVEPHAARADAVQTPERVGAAGLERERARERLACFPVPAGGDERLTETDLHLRARRCVPRDRLESPGGLRAISSPQRDVREAFHRVGLPRRKLERAPELLLRLGVRSGPGQGVSEPRERADVARIGRQHLAEVGLGLLEVALECPHVSSAEPRVDAPRIGIEQPVVGGFRGRELPRRDEPLRRFEIGPGPDRAGQRGGDERKKAPHPSGPDESDRVQDAPPL